MYGRRPLQIGTCSNKSVYAVNLALMWADNNSDGMGGNVGIRRPLINVCHIIINARCGRIVAVRSKGLKGSESIVCRWERISIAIPLVMAVARIPILLLMITAYALLAGAAPERKVRLPARLILIALRLLMAIL